MSKTIAITPSWFWPAFVPRMCGIPPIPLYQMAVGRWACRRPDDIAVIGARERLTWRELDARAAGGDFGPDGPLDDTLRLLAALRAGDRVSLPSGATSPGPVNLTEPVVAVRGTDHLVWHSHRSLTAAALALTSFFGLDERARWLSACQRHSWQGVVGALVPLVCGGTLVLSEPDDMLSTAAAEASEPLRIWASLDDTVAATRDAKGDAKRLQGALAAAILLVDGPLDIGPRRRITKLLRCPVLTAFGQAEAGVIFASHPAWYLDEAVGISVTNAHVVPVEPTSGSRIHTLWELVESAKVTVWSPSLAVGRGEIDAIVPLPDDPLDTGVVASSDANGMVYIIEANRAERG